MKHTMNLLIGALWVLGSLQASCSGHESKPSGDSEVFGKMTEKLASAKSIDLKVTSTVTSGGSTNRYSGSVVAGKGNLAFLEFEEIGKGPESRVTLVSDGNQLSCTLLQEIQKTPGNLTFVVNTVLGRGPIIGIFAGFREGPLDEDQLVRELETSTPRHLKVGAMEKISDRDARRVEFILGEEKDDEDNAVVTEWIDPLTFLPVMKIIRTKGRAVEEVYSEFRINQPLNPARMALPKK